MKVYFNKRSKVCLKLLLNKSLAYFFVDSICKLSNVARWKLSAVALLKLSTVALWVLPAIALCELSTAALTELFLF